MGLSLERLRKSYGCGEELPETKHKLDLLNYDFLHKRNLLFGTPEYVINKINELKSELNLQNLQVWSNFPGIDHKACMRSIKLFNDEVIPKINLDSSGIEIFDPAGPLIFVKLK